MMQDATPQRRSWWPAWRDFRMNRLAATAAAAVTVLAVVVVSYSLRPGLGILGPGAAPSPSPTLLARGNFVLGGGYVVDIEAVAQGSSATGRMAVTEGESGPSFIVDLECTRTTADGSILIGGVTTDTTTGVSPEGTYAAIVLKPGSPVRATVWSQRGGPGSQAPSCLAYLGEQSWRLNSGGMEPIEGTVELRVSGTGGANATPSPSPTLPARGHIDPRRARIGAGAPWS
jgi:hypothetical protein